MVKLPERFVPAVETEERRLAELVRQGERLLDRQLDLAAGQDEKSKQMLGTSMAVATALLAAFGLTWRPLPLGVQLAAIAGLACGLLLLLRALFSFSNAYLGPAGRPHRMGMGWNPNALLDESAQGEDVEGVHRATLVGLRKWVRHNEQVMERLGKMRRRALNDLTLATCCLVAVLIYVVIANAF
jgi:hypothetical protein